MFQIELKSRIDSVKIKRVFTKEHILIGRADSNDLVLPDPRVSGLHGQIVFKKNAYYYQDLRSTNGSMIENAGERYVIDGVKFKERALEHGDRLLLGDVHDPIVLDVQIREKSNEAAEVPDENKTVLATRAISDFSMLSDPLLDDKGLVRALFRFQKEINDLVDGPEIDKLVSRFFFSHFPYVEYVSIHREDPVEDGIFRQEHFSCRSTEVSVEFCEDPHFLESLLKDRKALLLKTEDLKEVRKSPGTGPLGSLAIAPLMTEKKLTGALEVGNTKWAQPLDEADLQLIAVAAFILANRQTNLKLLEVVQAAQDKLRYENSFLRSVLNKEGETATLIGESEPIEKIRKQIRTVGPSELTVLITGETGTGKELVARSIHLQSMRSGKLFAAVNCGTFSETLLESELFGHIKGSFTGAVENKKGLFEVADGGTLLLDEIGEIPYHLQVKLLRVLQENEVMAVGATKPKKVDVRVIAATNKDLAQEVGAGRFREDLFYRVNTFEIRLPSLRERGEDIWLLARHFLKIFRKEMNKPGLEFSKASRNLLLRNAFPGNIRQLKNEVQRAVLMADDGGEIEPQHFSSNLSEQGQKESTPELSINGRALKEIMEQYEIRVIRQALEEYSWNRSKTAQKLGISRQAFMTKLSKYGITPDS